MELDRVAIASVPLADLSRLALPTSLWPVPARSRAIARVAAATPAPARATGDCYGVNADSAVLIVDVMEMDTKFSTRWGRSASPPV